eukprot:GDKI01048893.1.p1 GENE.GDKI01048893.1~~GDKI01048893.1.p1  ORF type:complete len:577 (-),score=146.76 GDKI01048893.1:131-1861(-)
MSAPPKIAVQLVKENSAIAVNGMSDIVQGKLRSYAQQIAQFWRHQPDEYRPHYMINETAPKWVQHAWLRFWNAIKRNLMAFFFLLNIHSLTLLACSCVAVWGCLEFNLNWRFKVDTSFLAIAIVFPLSFGINQSFSRRESALRSMAMIKSTCASMFWGYRDWILVNKTNESERGDGNKKRCIEMEGMLFQFLLDLKCFVRWESGYECLSEHILAIRKKGLATLTGVTGKFDMSKDPQETEMDIENHVKQQLTRAYAREHGCDYWLAECYHTLSDMNVHVQQANADMGYTKGGEAVSNRMHVLVNTLTTEMEQIKTIVNYRTPTFLRYGCGMMIHVFAIALAPYFVTFCDTWSQGDRDPKTNKIIPDHNTCPAGYISSAAFVLAVMLMYKIQLALEFPFDINGLDDVFFELERELLQVTQGYLTNVKPRSESNAEAMLKVTTEEKEESDANTNAAAGVGAGVGGETNKEEIKHVELKKEEEKTDKKEAPVAAEQIHIATVTDTQPVKTDTLAETAAVPVVQETETANKTDINTTLAMQVGLHNSTDLHSLMKNVHEELADTHALDMEEQPLPKLNPQ